MKLPTSPILSSLFVCVLLFFTGNALATWQVTARWQLKLGASDEYHGIGANQPAALEAARVQCQNAQVLDEYKYFCLNSPITAFYSELPNGSYINSCWGCRVQANTLICDGCKPVKEQRSLDLSACPGDAINHIENCHGDLTCACTW
jgi:hypothetical protein